MNADILETIVKRGKYFYPAHKRYPGDLLVNCDRCSRQNLQACIGHGQYDLCLACAEYIFERSGKPLKPADKFLGRATTFMGREDYFPAGIPRPRPIDTPVDMSRAADFEPLPPPAPEPGYIFVPEEVEIEVDGEKYTIATEMMREDYLPDA